MKNLSFLIFLVFLSCKESGAGHQLNADNPVRKLFTVKTKAEHLEILSEDYRLFFEEKKGPGISKKILAEMLQWDYALNPKKTNLETVYSSKDSVVVILIEQNDFARLIGFPGWKSRNTYLIRDNKIVEQLFVPLDSVSYKDYLKEPVAWLLKNDSLELIKLYSTQTEGLRTLDSLSAVSWVKLLTKWKTETRQ